MINVQSEILDLLKLILRQHLPVDTRVLAFGSRLSSNNKNSDIKKHADLDLAIISNPPLSLALMGKLRLELEDSDIPFKIDLLNWADLSFEFREVIQKSSEELLRC